MQGLKMFGLVISVMLFGPLFLFSVASLAFNQTLGDQAYTKQTINEAGFYNAVGETIVTQAGGDEGDPLITTALNTAVSGNAIQNTLEPFIDETYNWLNGTTPQPELSLNISSIKTNFQQNLTTALQARAASLPACTTASQLQGDDVFTYTCIPPGTDVNQVITDTVTRVSNNASVFSDEIVADGTVSTDEAQALGINDPSQNLPSTLPRAYQFFTDGQWFFIGGAVITALGVIFLSQTWLYGLRKIGVLLLFNGLAILVFGLLMQFVVGSLVPTTSVEATESTVNALEQASKIILEDSARLLSIIGVVSVATGIVAIITSSVFITKKRQPTPKLPAMPTKPAPQKNDPTKL